MAMPMVHLLRTAASLLRLGPRPLDELPARSPTALSIIQRKFVLAVVLVSTQVQLLDKTNKIFNDVLKIGKMYCKALHQVLFILAVNIVGQDDIFEMSRGPQWIGECVVRVCISTKQDSQCEYQRLIYIYVPFSFLEVSNTVIAKNAVSPAIDSNNARDFTTFEFELILDVDGVEFGASWFLQGVSVNAGDEGKIPYLLWFTNGGQIFVVKDIVREQTTISEKRYVIWVIVLVIL